MLTEAILKANQALASLTLEQITAITTLSQNDENQVIANKYGEIYGQFDGIVQEITGEAKPQGKKTSEWVKEKLTSLKTKAEKAGDKTELENLQKELADAKEALKNNSGDAKLKGEVDRLAKEVADEKQRVKDLQSQLTNTAKDWEAKVEAEKGKLVSLRIDNEANAALAGMKFKDEKLIPPDLRKIAIDAAKAKILSEMKADWIDDGKGGQRLVFRDAQGQVKNNPENALNPFTFGELLAKELTPVLDTGNRQNGAGTSPNPANNGTNGTISVGTVKSKAEADEAINSQLMKLGISKTHKDYNTKYQEAMKQVPADLPLM